MYQHPMMNALITYCKHLLIKKYEKYGSFLRTKQKVGHNPIHVGNSFRNFLLVSFLHLEMYRIGITLGTQF